MRKFGEIYFSRIKYRILIGAVASVVGGCLMCLVFAVLFGVVLPAIDQSGGTFDPALLLVGFPVCIAALVGLGVAVAGFSIWQRARGLDAVFKPLGLTGGMYMLFGRHYHGKFNGRELNVYIYRGPAVELRLGVAPQTRFIVSQRSAVISGLGQFFDSTPLPLEGEAFRDLHVVSADRAWTGQLFALPETARPVTRLMTDGAPWAILRRVELHPGELLLRLDRSRKIMFTGIVDAAEIQVWLEALQTLAALAESLPAPQVNVPPSTSSPSSRRRLNSVLGWSVLAILVLCPLCSILIFVSAYLFAMLSNGG